MSPAWTEWDGETRPAPEGQRGRETPQQAAARRAMQRALLEGLELACPPAGRPMSDEECRRRFLSGEG